MRNLNRQFGAGHTGNAAGRHKDEDKIADLELGYLSQVLDTLGELARNSKNESIRATAT